jgi:LPS export ABC transporter protein LptC
LEESAGDIPLMFEKKISLGFLIFFFLVARASVSAETTQISSSESSSEPQQMQDFNIVGYGARGEKTWEVQGANMDMLGNDVKISDITAHLYGAKENMVLTADKGHFDKDTGVVHLQDHVRAVTDSGAQLKTDTLDWSQKDQVITTNDRVNITKDNMTAVGQGIEAKPDFKVATLEKDVILTVEKQKQAKESAAKEGNFQMGKMVITCEGPMELNYEKQYATFEKNVRVEGDADQGTMSADKMTLRFNTETKQVDRMEAEGNVKIIRGDNISLSNGAVFIAADKTLHLTGRPKLILFTSPENSPASTPAKGKGLITPSSKKKKD